MECHVALSVAHYTSEMCDQSANVELISVLICASLVNLPQKFGIHEIPASLQTNVCIL